MKKINIFLLLLLIIINNSYTQNNDELLNSGMDYKEQRNYNKAIKDFTKIIKSNPSHINAYYQRADTYYLIDKYDKAIDDLSKAIQLKPDSGLFYYTRANCHRFEKNFQAALADYNKAIQLAPETGRYYFGRAGYYQDVEDYNRALNDYNRAISLDPKFLYNYLYLADLLIRMKNDEAAFEYYEKAIEMKVNSLYSYLQYLIASFQHSQAKYQQTLSLIKDNIHQFQSDDWQNKLAQFITGKISEKELLKGSIIYKDKKCEAFFYIGYQHFFRGNKKDAIKYFKKTLNTKKKNYYEYQAAEYILKQLYSG